MSDLAFSFSPTIRWFGDAWGVDGPAAICAPGYQIPVPVGEGCVRCPRKIEEGDQGVRIVSSLPPSAEALRTGHWDAPSYHLFCWIENSQGPHMAAHIMDELRKAGPQTVVSSPMSDPERWYCEVCQDWFYDWRT